MHLATSVVGRASPCHRWSVEAHLSPDRTRRGRNGRLSGLVLEGTTRVACQFGGTVSTPPRTHGPVGTEEQCGEYDAVTLVLMEAD